MTYNESAKNVAERIGQLIINGYSVSSGRSISIGNFSTMQEITLKKRHAYYDENDSLQGYDEKITIDVNSGDMTLSYSTVENYRRYPTK